MTAIDRLIAADRQSSKRIAVIGDALVDRWVDGELHECQDGCPKFVARESKKTPGGAANAANQLFNWNCQVTLMARTGVPGSDEGLMNYDYYHISNFRPELIEGKLETKERLLVDGKIFFRIDHPSFYQFIHPDKMVEFRNSCVEHLSKVHFDAVLIADYDKGLLDYPTIRQIIETCRRRDIPVVADGKRPPYWYDGAILKINADYARRHMDGIQKHDPLVVITQGGFSPATCGKSVIWDNVMPVLPDVPCVNHVGAGDCFAAHMVLGLAHGERGSRLLSIAHSAGRVFVQHRYARPPWPHEIRRDALGAEGKVIDRLDLERLRQSVEKPQRIVFTNGVFRMPHAGHAWLLDTIKAQYGGTLVVGINSDDSARRLRGQGEFLLPIQERVGIISRLSAVDWIVVYDEEDPCEVMKSLNPDLLVKGHEYRDQLIPGSSMAQVAFAPPSPYDRHVTDIVQSMKR